MADFITRAQRRTGQLLRAMVPRNEHYRPTGLQPSARALAAAPDSGATYLEIYPAYTSHLTVPPEFVTLAPAYYDRIAEREPVPPAFVLLLPDARLNVDSYCSLAIIDHANKLVGDVSLQFSPGNFAVAPPAENPIFKQRYFRPPIELSGTVCSLLSGGGAAVGNYYHWLLDSLPRLHLIEEAGLLGEIDYFLIYSREHYFAVEMLLAMGIRNEQILDVQSATHLRAERLVVTSPVRGTGRHAPRWAGTFLKDAFRPLADEAANSARFSPLVYVSRRDASFRRVRNEEEVEALLAKFGFESYALTELSFREKAALFSGARAVVGPVGAGLANILFCAEGTPLVELLPHNLVVPDYLDLTARLGMPHYPLICAREAESAHRATADRQDDLTVDLDALRHTVQLALGQPVRRAVAVG
jgi:hypothetical protein